ncbi:hypothetical protein QFZ43_003273 [Streptomyces afghaniensis]|nr:hypothetical protein [Streptomyces afghaniensis]
MRLQCTSKRTIQLRTLQLAEEGLPCPIEGFEAEPFDVFRCELGDEDHEFHGAFLDELADKKRDAYFCWSGVDGAQFIIASEPCGKRGGDEEICNLFENHPGVCDWDLIDPLQVAIQALVDQTMAYLRDHGERPPLPKRGSD